MRRRDFLSLCGLAAGSCLVPAAVARIIRETCVLADQPYLILPRNPRDTLYAYGSGLLRSSGLGLNTANRKLSTTASGPFMLHWGDPQESQTPPTWRDYFDEYEGFDIKDKTAVREWWTEQVGDPDDDPITIKASETIDGAALEKWENQQEMHEGPSARAYRLLEDLPLDDGRGVGGDSPLGELRFIEGDRPGSNLTYVEAPDLAALACLQNRLNGLGQDLAIEIRIW